MIVNSGFIKVMNRIVSNIPMTSDKTPAPATVRRMPFISPAPNFCAVNTVKPAVIPTTKPYSINMIVPVLPTAASALLPTNLPTMIVSAIL